MGLGILSNQESEHGVDPKPGEPFHVLLAARYNFGETFLDNIFEVLCPPAPEHDGQAGLVALVWEGISFNSTLSSFQVNRTRLW